MEEANTNTTQCPATGGNNWVDGAVAHLEEKLKTQAQITADDLRDYCPEMAGSKRQAVGSVFRKLNLAGRIVFSHKERSKVASRRGGMNSVWQRVPADPAPTSTGATV